MYESAIGTTTGKAAVVARRARPARGARSHPDAPRLDPLAARGGRRHDPVAGPWKRPSRTASTPRTRCAVHESLGVIDVSTLGKLLVEGPEAV